MNTLRQFSLVIALCGAVGFAAASPANAQAVYNFTNFDGLGDNLFGTTINGISSNGVEVGFSAGAGVFTNFLRNPNGVFVPLNVINGLSNFAQANGVNNQNTVVGSTGAGGAFVGNGSQGVILPDANPGNTVSQVAFGINNVNQIVGQYTDSVTGNTPGFLYDVPTSKFTLFNPPVIATVTNVQGINDNGLSVGFYSADGVHQHGFSWDTNTNTVTLLADPSTPRILNSGLVLTQFLGVNALNEAVGYYQTTNGSQFGFTYDLNTQTYAFLDDPQAAPVNGVQITQITGVDDKGDLAGFYMDALGNQRGFFAAAVPEPGSVALAVCLSLSAGGLLLRRRDR